MPGPPRAKDRYLCTPRIFTGGGAKEGGVRACSAMAAEVTWMLAVRQRANACTSKYLGSGLGVQGPGCMVPGLLIGVQTSGAQSRDQEKGFRVKDLKLGVEELGCQAARQRLPHRSCQHRASRCLTQRRVGTEAPRSQENANPPGTPKRAYRGISLIRPPPPSPGPP